MLTFADKEGEGVKNDQNNDSADSESEVSFYNNSRWRIQYVWRTIPKKIFLSTQIHHWGLSVNFRHIASFILHF